MRPLRWPSLLRHRLRSLFQRRTVEAELAEELQDHLERTTERLVQSGMSISEARLAARRELRGLEQIKEECRDMRRVRPIEDLGRDLAFALRLLRKSPGFTLVVLTVLALGIGANTALFSLVNQILLRNLPVRNPDELVVMQSKFPRWGTMSSFSYPMFKELRDRNTVLSGIFVQSGVDLNVGHAGESSKAVGLLVSADYFPTLGLRPFLGHFFDAADEERAIANPVAVITYEYWQRHFAGDRAVLGRDIVLNGRPTAIIGVTAPGFYGTDLSSRPELMVPVTLKKVFEPVPADRFENSGQQWLRLMGRLKPGVPIEQAQAALDVLQHQVRKESIAAAKTPVRPETRETLLNAHLELLPGAQGFGYMQRELSKSLNLLFAISGIILVITCANLANMLLARNAARAEEVRMRLALGAGRMRLVRQWLTESALLALLGGGLGVLLSIWCQRALISFIPEMHRSNLVATPEPLLLGFAVAVSLLTGLLFGLAPAVQASRSSLLGTSRGEAKSGFRAGLITLQIALCLPLLIVAGLFLVSLRNTRSLPTGFEASNVVLASVDPSLNGYPQPRVVQFYQDFVEQARTLPGAEEAGLANVVVLSGNADQMVLAVEGHEKKPGDERSALVATISPGYFRAMRLPVLAGRDFGPQDSAISKSVAIINETMARRYFTGKNPIGMRFGLGSDEEPRDLEVVGVVKDAKYVRMTEKPESQFYLPMGQNPELREMTLHLRASGDTGLLIELLRAKARGIDPNVPLFNVKALSNGIDESLAQDRLLTWLSAALGVLATVLCAVGLYGVVAFSVARRTREVGIRMALGAQRKDIFALIVKRVTLLVLIGVGAGALLAFLGSQVLTSLLFGINPTDAVVFIGATIVLLAAAAVATWLPARRALRVDPSVALRCE